MFMLNLCWMSNEIDIAMYTVNSIIFSTGPIVSIKAYWQLLEN